MKTLFETIHDSPTTARDLCGLFLGKLIGSGMSRQVYQFAHDKEYVVKVDVTDSRFQNVLEWEVWQTVKDTKYAKWFAPCLDISANGHFLIQKKIEKIPKKQYPKKIPPFFTDLKYDNFGVIGKQFVCCDYGTAHIDALNAYFLKKELKQKKGDWWEQ